LIERNPYPRADWPSLLSALPAAEVRRVAQTLAAAYRVEDLLLPQSGLGLLQLRDSALGERYFLGEIPLARAHVRMTNRDGQSIEGAAQLLDDRAGLARAIAILDGLLAASPTGIEAALNLLQAGDEIRQRTQRERRALLSATRVDFAMLGTADEEDEDA
jgi:alpha-D-ribose 1-methylphosphonate 5-triphosphate synthase subunit PhnG